MRPRPAWILLLAASSLACASPAIETRPSVDARFAGLGIRTVALVFEDRSGQRDWGGVRSQEVQTALEGTLLADKSYAVVTRSRLDEILGEAELSVRDLTSEPFRFGALDLVDALVFVEVETLDYYDGWRGSLSVTLLDVETGGILFTNTATFEGLAVFDWGFDLSGRQRKLTQAVVEASTRALADLPAAAPDA